MDSAKAKVKDLLSSSGQHDTTVHHTTAPAVTNEQVARHEHEHVTPAINKEVHKDHYHTSVQPVKHSETLPEQHHHQSMPVESRSFEHDNPDDVKRNVAEQKSQFQDQTRHVEGPRTTTHAPVVSGEHRHHHVHETIQPVIEKQTIEPHVVHTTVPVHEKHHDVSQHHAGSTLPAMTMEEFAQHNSSGGTRTQHFKGEPQLVANATSGAGSHGLTERDGRTAGTTGGSNFNNSGTTSTSGTRDPLAGDSRTSGGLDGTSGTSGVGSRDQNQGVGNTTTNPASNSTSTPTSTTGKPSLLDKLNPRKDADGDGKAGFMK